MSRVVRWIIIGSAALLALAGCGRYWLAEREPWRHEAEEQCLKSGAVREGPGVVLVRPIAGPGVCGADFPLKIAALGESRVLGYGDELRPPGSIPQASLRPPGSIPRGSQRPPPGYPADTPFAVNPAYPADTRLPPQTDYRGPTFGGVAGRSGDPLSLSPPGIDPPGIDAPGDVPPSRYGAPRTVPAQRSPVDSRPIDSEREDALLNGYPPPPSGRESERPFGRPPYPSAAPNVPMSRGRVAMASIGPAEVKPSATLACPIVSALDQWVTDAVQPAALRWFAQPVVEIRQISAYSCRGMNGNPGANISEHAFGNALDVAGFKLADGHVITVKGGWRGTPEEQGFLHDVQLAACEQFTTVLAPGSNSYHYDHIHLDLMRRASGRRICQPAAIPGEVVAARVRARYAGKGRGEPGITGSVGTHRTAQAPSWPFRNNRGASDSALPYAIPGED